MRGLVCAGWSGCSGYSSLSNVQASRTIRLIECSGLSNVQAYRTIALLDVQAYRFCRFTSALPIALPAFRFAFLRRFRARFSLPASLFRQPYALRTSLNPTHLENCTGSWPDKTSTPAFRSSPRPISIIKLHPLPNFHRWPIYLIVSEGSYLLLAVAILFSRWASRLDAFSVYPFRTSLPSCALGSTTVAPEVRPSRSSRTRDSSCQNSCAHDG